MTTGYRNKRQVKAFMRRVLKNVHAIGRQSPQQRPTPAERAAPIQLCGLRAVGRL